MRRLKLLTLVFMLGFVQLGFAHQWESKTTAEYNVKNQAQYRLIEFYNKNTEQTVRLHTVSLSNNQYSAALVDQIPQIKHITLRKIYQTTKVNHAFLGINASYFTPENKPLGLVIMQGKKINPLSHSSLLTGIVFVNSSGLHITTRNSPIKNADYALQAGPFLIRPGGQLAIKSKGEVNRRTVLALTGANNLLVISASPVSLYNLAHLLKKHPQAFGAKSIKVALNLDGGSSTAMSILFPHKSAMVIPEILPVKNALVFKLKSA